MTLPRPVAVPLPGAASDPAIRGPATPVGVEALARLCDRRCVAVSPEVFIPLAERPGLIAPLGRYVLDAACAAAAAWHARDPAAKRVGAAACAGRLATVPGLLETAS